VTPSSTRAVAISGHLQEQINELQGQFAMLHKVIHEESRADIDRLHRELASTSARVEAMGTEVAIAASGLQKLVENADASGKVVASLQDGQKVITFKIQQVGDELLQTAGLAGRLQTEIEKKLELDVVFLRGEQEKTRLVLDQLSNEEEQSKRSLQELRAMLRETNATAKSHANDLSETSVMVQNLESRMTENMSSFKARGVNLADLNTAVLKLHEDHENTKVHTEDLHSSVTKLLGHVNNLTENVENTATGMSLTQGELDSCRGALDDLSEDFNHLHEKVVGLAQSHANLNMSMEEVRETVAEADLEGLESRGGRSSGSSRKHSKDPTVLPSFQDDAYEGQGRNPSRSLPTLPSLDESGAWQSLAKGKSKSQTMSFDMQGQSTA